ncbi:MAG: DUF1501 domain-containing protein [Myxococcales bacterium]|nr:DUF1501 domain-containing protein [Myxococcales bacterium]MCB9701134.1 DUF1501 domain-containing protein [Myxococcales bacterium]
MTGLAVAAPRTARAAFQPYAGPFFVFVSARGGWDPTYFCDPKPKDPSKFNRLYDYDAATHKVGNLPYANIPVSGAALGLDAMADPYLMSAKDFFTAHGDQIRLINGINTETNNHDRGVKTTFSGRGDRDYPALAAMIAADRAPAHPLAFISSGGYANSGNLLPVTRLNSVSSFQKIASPNLVNVADPMGPTYHNPDTYQRILDAQAARTMDLSNGNDLPRIKTSANELYVARGNMDTLASVELPGALVDLPGNLGDLERMMQQTQLALAAFKAGLAVSANIELGGFDTHANHDINQVRQLAKLFHGIHFLLQEAEAQGLLGELIIFVGSDFGRGKGYNGPGAADGKDHWPVTSMMAISGDPGVIGGNTLIGASTVDDQLPMTVDPVTLETLDDPMMGVQIKWGEVHKAMRAFAGIGPDHPYSSKFPIIAEDLPLFG